MEQIKQYFPILATVLVAVASLFVTAASDNVITQDEFGNLILALLGAVGLYVVPRLVNLRWLKPLVTGLTGAAQFAFSVWGDGITMSEWVQIGLTFLGGVGVLLTNKYVPLTRPEPLPEVRSGT
jgi:hypothetical protein